ncbi:expressed unknown protein [Seminavis robusta]|uniref:Uncharacterized protein n=1 Tax=Seminavis robusta TaxID=568900 RepID=A0A9N8HHZ7_9STRA|nr:expressed unknown protein [Seminavis robusta]|eukprot:Sro564_g167360.1 n/a (120) ;mRNA; r:28622-28981
MNQRYKKYCEMELKKNPRKILPSPIEITDTLLSSTFCNRPRAELWLKDNSAFKEPHHEFVCHAIAPVGSITVMKWARQNGFPWNEMTSAYAAENGHLRMVVHGIIRHAQVRLKVDNWKF